MNLLPYRLFLVSIITIHVSSLSLTYAQPTQPGRPDIRRRPLPPRPMETNSKDPTAPAGTTTKTGSEKGDLPLPGEQEFVECQKFPRGKKVAFNLKPETDLVELVGFIKPISCRPFVFSSIITSRQPKVTVIVPEYVTANEAYRIFLSAVESMGFTVQPTGKVLKIIPLDNAKENSNTIVGSNETSPAIDQFVTQIFRLRYANPEALVNQVLNKKKTRNGDISPYTPTKSIIITDNAFSVRAMGELIKTLDVPTVSSEKPWLIHLKNMLAADAKQELEQLFNTNKNNQNNPSQPYSRPPPGSSSGGNDSSSPAEFSISQIITDDRTNSVILVGTESAFRLALGLMEKLDVPGGNGASRMNVYELENANAEELATVLNTVCGGSGGTANSVPVNRSPGSTGRPNAIPIGLEGNNQSCQTAKITANKGTNSLLIISTIKEYFTLRDIIKKLDRPKMQVYLEGYIIEIGMNKTRDVGVSFHGGYNFNDTPLKGGTVVGGLQSKSLSSLNPSSILGLSGLLGGLIGPAMSSSVFGPTESGSKTILPPLWGALIQANQTTQDIDFLQVPHMTFTDNEKGVIEVTKNIGYLGGITGVPGVAGGSAATFQSVQRQNVGLKLEVTPHVNSSDLLRLEINCDVDDLDSTKAPDSLGPSFNKRNIKTVVVVRDQQSVVLGGIVRDRNTIQVTKIPLLGDIPILGYLFKTKSTEVEKRMLLIILKPYIIRNPGDQERIFEKKNREKDEFREANLALIKDEPKGIKPDYEHQPGALDIINKTIADANKEFKESQEKPENTAPILESGPIDTSSKK